MREMDQLLALHCAPTLLGIKPANLIRLSSEQIPRLTAAICEYDRLLSAKGIRLEMLCRCSTSALLLVHSPAQLQALLRRPPQRRMLLQAGYPPSGKLSCLIQLECSIKRIYHLNYNFIESSAVCVIP